MKRILPFALGVLSVFALFAASPILPTLGIPLNADRVLRTLLPDAWETALAEPSFTGDKAIITSYCIGEVGQLLPTVDDNGIEGYWSVLMSDGTLVPVERAITSFNVDNLQVGSDRISTAKQQVINLAGL